MRGSCARRTFIMSRLTLSLASTIVDRALAKARAEGAKPLTVAVLDAGGHPVALKREDNCSSMRPQIAAGKAWGALGMGFGTRELAQRAAAAPTFVNALVEVSGGRLVPAPGGVLIRDASGDIIGAV